jgi:cell wall-associated NlpC family hydrolase
VPSTRRLIRAQWLFVTAAALTIVMGTPTFSAHADPVYPSAGEVARAKAAAGDKAAQVATIENQLVASNARLVNVQMAAEVASEKYNLARVLLEQRTEAARGAGRRAAEAQKTADASSDKLGQFAATAYMQGGNLGQLEAFLSSKGPQEVLERAAGIQLVTDIRSRIMQDAQASSEVAAVLRRQAAQAQAQQLAAELAAESARAAAQTQVDLAVAETANIKKQQGAMIAQLAALRSTSVALEGQRQAGLKAAAEARAAARARAAAEAADARRARAAARNQGGGSSFPVPSRGGVSAVIAFAESQIGEPYVWGAAGPSSWDCSGLTQRAWAQAGVNLAHYTGFQWAETRRIPLADLQPGDLVFYGGSGPSSHHVGLYIGSGTMIEAPHTGAFVRYSPIYRSDLLPYGGRP